MSSLKKSSKNNSKYVLRPFGKLTDDLEKICGEAAESHELQAGEIITWVYNYLMIHYPDSIEKYVDNTVPVLYYGHQDYIRTNTDEES